MLFHKVKRVLRTLTVRRVRWLGVCVWGGAKALGSKPEDLLPIPGAHLVVGNN